MQENLTIVISGDTAINADSTNKDDSQLIELYNGADLLILHVGDIEKPNEQRYDSDHLGFQDVIEILSKMNPNLNWLY